MRKDYIAAPDDATPEAAFIEDHWTGVWRCQGMAPPPGWRMHFKDEYRIMAPYLRRLPPGARLLDGGCGLGEWTLFLTRRGFSVVGLDISREVVNALRCRYPGHKFVVGDVRVTGFPDANFDGYFSWGTSEHFEEGLGPCIAEARRVLKPGGVLFVSVPFDNLCQRRRADGPPPEAHRFYQWRLSREELCAVLADGGLEVRPIHVRQGVIRVLQHGLSVDWRNPVTRLLATVLAPVVPVARFAHMLLAVARKPGTMP